MGSVKPQQFITLPEIRTLPASELRMLDVDGLYARFIRYCSWVCCYQITTKMIPYICFWLLFLSVYFLWLLKIRWTRQLNVTSSHSFLENGTSLPVWDFSRYRETSLLNNNSLHKHKVAVPSQIWCHWTGFLYLFGVGCISSSCNSPSFFCKIAGFNRIWRTGVRTCSDSAPVVHAPSPHVNQIPSRRLDLPKIPSPKNDLQVVLHFL